MERLRMQPANRASNRPLGASGDLRRRLLRHHLPLVLASAMVVVLFMMLPAFDVNKYLTGDIFSGAFPQDFPVGQTGTDAGRHQPPQQQGEGHQRSQQQDEGHPQQQGEPTDQSGHTSTTNRGGGSFLGLSVRRFTVGTGYVAVGLLALTLLIGTANLLLRRRTPVSNYLTRDVGMCASIFSVVHVLFGLEVHASVTDPLPMFVLDGSPLTNSFGLANWTGLAATVIVVGLLAISSDFALGKLKARRWKNLQRLNYALCVLVILHAFFYGALLRTDSPYTILLIVSAIVVFIGQAVGIWLWRRRRARASAKYVGATG